MIVKVIAKGRGENKYLEASFIIFRRKKDAKRFIIHYYKGYDKYKISFIPEKDWDWDNKSLEYAFNLFEYKSAYKKKSLSKDRAYGMEFTISKDEFGYDHEYFSGRQPRISDYI